MDRPLLEKILKNAPGISHTSGAYLVADEHRVSIYLGRGGQATVLTELVRIALHDEYVEAEAKDRTLHFAGYEPVLAVSIRRPRQDVARTGF